MIHEKLNFILKTLLLWGFDLEIGFGEKVQERWWWW